MVTARFDTGRLVVGGPVTVRIVAGLLLWGALAGCAHDRQRFDARPEQLPKASEFEGEDGAVLFERQYVRFYEEEGQPVADITHHSRHVVFTDDGRHLAQVAMVYDGRFTEPLELHARTISPDGKVTDYDTKDAVDTPAFPGWILYTDTRAFHLDLSGSVQLGTVFEYRYTVKQKDAEKFRQAHGFGTNVPVVESRFEVVFPSGWDVEHVAHRFAQPVDVPPEVLDEGAEKRLVWLEHDLSSYLWETRGPSDHFRGALVSVRLNRWTEGGKVMDAVPDERDVSRWFYENAADRAEVTPEIEAIAREALAGSPDDPHEKAKRLYSWTRDNINYCAIEIGWGGWIPHPASKTESLRYGDCKDKANLLRTLLKTQGIQSDLTAIKAHAGLPHPYPLPTLIGNFNHQILSVTLPDGNVLCDPTTRVVPFGRLPASDQGAPVLRESKVGARIETSAVSGPDVNLRELEIDLKLVPGKRVVGTFKLKLDGAEADSFRSDLLATTSSGHKKLVDDWLPLAEDTVSEVKIENGPPPVDPLPVLIEGKATGLKLSKLSSRTFFRIGHYLSLDAPTFPEGKPRTLPVVLGPARRYSDTVRLELPAGARLSTVPEPVKIEGGIGTYELRIREANERVIIERVFERRVSVVQPEQYEELIAFLDKLHAAETQPIVLRMPGEPAAADADKAGEGS